MPLVFDLGPLDDLEAQATEDLDHLAHGPRNRVQAAQGGPAAGKRDIDGRTGRSDGLQGLLAGLLAGQVQAHLL